MTLAVSSIPVAGMILGALLEGPIAVGAGWVSLKMARGESVSFTDAFAGFGPRFLPLMLYSLVYKLGTTIGLLLLIIPGVYLMVAWLFADLLVLDRNLDFWEALELSRKTVNPRWFWFFGLVLIMAVIYICGSLLCGVGIIVAIPYSTTILAVTYNKLFPRT